MYTNLFLFFQYKHLWLFLTILTLYIMNEEQKYLEEKHNRGVIINDDNEDWGGCSKRYEEETDK